MNAKQYSEALVRKDRRIAELEVENTELRKQNEILATTRRLEEEVREQAEEAVCYLCGNPVDTTDPTSEHWPEAGGWRHFDCPEQPRSD